MTLQEFFAENPRAAIAFSGGVDSSYLLYAAVQCGADVHAYFAKTAFQPQFELDDAQRLAESVGAKLTVLELDALSSEDVARNPANRCYYCKQNIFGNLKRAAAEDGFTLILDGTNASDDAGDRPGMRALREMDVRSPLRECGLTKAEIRRLSHEAGLFTWDKPAYACLATRVPTGTRITPGCWPPRSAPRAGCSRRATRTSASACWTAAPACSSRQISFPGRWPSTTRSSRP
ncbi:MAG: asparagine synthase-related protein [Oscillospiraceae bacterium]